VLDLPNLKNPDGCPTQVDVALKDVTDRERDRCITDNLLTFYERETDTLIMRPLIPLRGEKTQYAPSSPTHARLRQGRDQTAASRCAHPLVSSTTRPEDAMARLKAHLSNADLSSYYGDIGGTGSSTSRSRGPSPRSPCRKICG
jgi:hypothetical protein